MNRETQEDQAIVLNQTMERVERLKEHVLSAQPPLCIDRARLLTQSFKESEGEPIVLRRAKGLAKFLRECPIYIHEDELIVGDRTPIDIHVAYNFPEFWIHPPECSDPALRQELEEIFSYWRQRPHLRAQGLLFGHTVSGFERLLRLGFNGIREEAENKLRTMDTTAPEDLRKKPFWEAVIIICDAGSEFGRRHAQLAHRLADSESDSLRKQELLKIAEICSWVPANPARNFHEACQSLWFVHMMMQYEDPQNAQSTGRFDQFMYPYFQKDLLDGKLTEQRALELIECLWLKYWRSYDVQNLMLAGLTPEGKDATNELSYLCIQATINLKLLRQISVRYHANLPRPFLLKVCELIKLGLGIPQIFNDEAVIPALLNKGITLEDARNYAVIGCIELTIPGKTDPRVVAHYSNLLKCLELALNNGKCLLTAKQLGPRTGNATDFTCFEEVMEAYKKQVAHELKIAVSRVNELDLIQPQCFPMVILSTLTEDCVEKGLDITAGGAHYNSTGVCATGIANVADSLAAIKKMVFEEKKLSMAELVELLKTDFEGNETMRQMLLSQVPKYGNDDDYVDSLACEVVRYYAQELEKYRNPRGGKFHLHLLSFTNLIGFGRACAASPDGRKSGEPIANSLAAQQGMDRKGPTALIKSVIKLDHMLAAAGVSFMIDLHPTAISGENGTEKLAALLKSYFDLKGMHIQFNIVGEETLRKAQKEPQKYRNLVVRVAGYSAYFTTLSPELQEHVIARMKHRHF